jgi:hypothetical protein
MGGSSGHRTWPIKEEIDAGILPFACRLCRNSVGIGRARELAREALVRWDLHKHAGLAELIITELTTNALRHGVGQIEIGLSYSGGVHRLPVRDVPGRGAPPRLRPGGTGLCGPSRRPGEPPAHSPPTRPGSLWPPSRTTCCVPPGPWPASPAPKPAVPPCAVTSSTSPPAPPATDTATSPCTCLAPQDRMDEPLRSRLRPAHPGGLTSPDQVTHPTAPNGHPKSGPRPQESVDKPQTGKRPNNNAHQQR